MFFRRLFRRRERTLGVARRKRRYDLPLNKGTGTGFLVLLIALMTFLAMMATGASFALSKLQDRWTSGLENRVTVEIAAEDTEGNLLDSATVREQAEDIAIMLSGHPAVSDVHILSEEEIRDLVEPWLGNGLLLADMPLPALIGVTLLDAAPETVRILQDKIRIIAPQARIDTHQGWLHDVLRFTGALKFAALLLIVTIGITTITAVAGGVRSRMAVYEDEVQLLHLMGATDNYIARQFQRYALLIGLQGGALGTAAGTLAMLAIGWSAGRMDINLLPNFSLSPLQIVILAMLPLLAAAIATATARRTTIRALLTLP